MSEKNPERYSNTADCSVPIQGKYRRNVIDIAKAYFRICYRSVKLNREQWRFDVHTVDADETLVKEFLEEYPMCRVENTFSEVQSSMPKVANSRSKAIVR